MAHHLVRRPQRLEPPRNGVSGISSPARAAPCPGGDDPRGWWYVRVDSRMVTVAFRRPVASADRRCGGEPTGRRRAGRPPRGGGGGRPGSPGPGRNYRGGLDDGAGPDPLHAWPAAEHASTTAFSEPRSMAQRPGRRERRSCAVELVPRGHLTIPATQRQVRPQSPGATSARADSRPSSESGSRAGERSWVTSTMPIRSRGNAGTPPRSRHHPTRYSSCLGGRRPVAALPLLRPAPFHRAGAA